MASITLNHIDKTYDDGFHAIKDVNLEIEDGAFILRETAPGVSVAEIAEKTAGRLIVPDDVKEMTF